MFKLMDKKIIAILRSKSLLNWPYALSYFIEKGTLVSEISMYTTLNLLTNFCPENVVCFYVCCKYLNAVILQNFMAFHDQIGRI